MKRVTIFLVSVFCSLSLLAGESDSTCSQDSKQGKPLIIVDGEVYEGNVGDIPPKETYSVCMYRDSMAIAMYGEEAGKNGVVVIYTHEWAKQHPDSVPAVNAKTDKAYKKNLADRLRMAGFVLMVAAILIVWLLLIPFILIGYDRYKLKEAAPSTEAPKPADSYAPLRLRLAENLIDEVILSICRPIAIIPLYTFWYVPFSIEHMDKDASLIILEYCVWFLVVCAIIFLYYFICEYYMGRTVGKFFSKTKVVTLDGEKPSAKTILIRTLCRFIPFDSISCLFTKVDENGNMTLFWHDTLSITRVVRNK